MYESFVLFVPLLAFVLPECCMPVTRTVHLLSVRETINEGEAEMGKLDGMVAIRGEYVSASFFSHKPASPYAEHRYRAILLMPERNRQKNRHR